MITSIRKLSTLLAAACLGLLAAAPAQAEKAQEPKTCIPASREGQEWWKTRNAAFNVIAQQRNAKIVFLGDSITHNWEIPGRVSWETHFAPLDAVNFGISGDKTENILWRIESGNFSGKMNPKLIVLMIGTNNWRDEAGDTAKGVKKILKTLQKSEPQAKILLLAIFPRGADKNDAARQKNERVNAEIEKYADGKRIFWLNINDIFLEKDEARTLPKAVMPDLLHPSAEGHRRWAEAVLPRIKQLSR